MADETGSVSKPALRLVAQANPRLDWPERSERFGLSRLAEISGVDAPTIKRWAHRSSIKFRRIGTGNVRAYRLDEALHLAVIAEMTQLNLSITGRGASLSDAIAEWIEHRLRADPDVYRLQPVALVPVENEDDFTMVQDLPRAIADGSCVIMGVQRIARGVLERYRAAPS